MVDECNHKSVDLSNLPAQAPKYLLAVAELWSLSFGQGSTALSISSQSSFVGILQGEFALFKLHAIFLTAS